MRPQPSPAMLASPRSSGARLYGASLPSPRERASARCERTCGVYARHILQEVEHRRAAAERKNRIVAKEAGAVARRSSIVQETAERRSELRRLSISRHEGLLRPDPLAHAATDVPRSRTVVVT